LLKKNKINDENKISILSEPYCICVSLVGSGLLLNDKTTLCKACFEIIGKTAYLERYQRIYNQYRLDYNACHAMMADLFQTSKQNVSHHIGKIFA
jgi:hypothetical protein